MKIAELHIRYSKKAKNINITMNKKRNGEKPFLMNTEIAAYFCFFLRITITATTAAVITTTPIAIQMKMQTPSG